MSDSRTVGQQLAATALALLGVAVVAGLDWGVPVNFAAAEFYLVPVALIAWYQGLKPGTWIVLAASVISFGFAPYVAGETDYGQKQYLAILVHVGHLTLAALIMAKLRSAIDGERQLARIDPLTGLYNQREFYSRARTELDRCRRSQAPFTLAYIDVDDFKAVNDEHGHREGDRVLVAAAEAMREAVRSIDVTARMGGDEFAVVMADTDEKTALQVAERLRESVNSVSGELADGVTVSVGVAVFEGCPETVDQMVTCADRLMYEAKTEGKDRVVARRC